MIGTILRITRFTIADELRHRSFYLLTVVAVGFVLLLRGCFKGNVMMNGQAIDNVTVGWHASFIAFHMVSIAGMLMATLLSMRLFARESSDGSLMFFLSKSLRRNEFVTGSVLGIWTISFAFTFVLHLTIYIIMLIYSGGRIPWFMAGSLLISLNSLFVVLLVLFLSTILPDVIAALFAIGVGIIGYVSDSIYVVSKSSVAKSMIQSTGVQPSETISLWRIIWPKTGALEYFTTALIKGDTPAVMAGIPPYLNLIGWCALLLVLLLWRFERREIV